MRAQLPLKYTQGFNPHPVLAVVCPRPVGVASRDDLVVLWTTEPLAPPEVARRIGPQLPRGMSLLRVEVLQGRRCPQARRARYEWPVPPDRADALRQAVEAFRAAPSWPAARYKGGQRDGQAQPTRTIDLKTLVERVDLDARSLRWTVVPDGDLWARPAEVLEALGLDGRTDLAAAARVAVEYDL